MQSNKNQPPDEDLNESNIVLQDTANLGLPIIDDENTKQDPPSSVNDQWSRETLLTSFNCMKLIADDFLDSFLIEKELIKAIIGCLSIFTAQTRDVNISLTSVELLWKVADFAITNHNQSKSSNNLGLEYVSYVLDVLLTTLNSLSMDSRPEV